jgi:hypothetical protein
VFTEKRNQLFPRFGGGKCQLQRGVSIVSFFALLATAAGQDAGAPVSTNQPAAQNVSSNAPPPQYIEPSAPPPAESEQLAGPNGLTNQFGVTPPEPPPLGPASVGSSLPAAPIMGTSALSGAPGPVFNGPPTAGFSLWGPVVIHPHLLYTFLDGNGIEAAPGQPSQTVINTVAPGFLLNIGPAWSIDYTPSLSYYSNPVFKNTLNESASLRGNWTNNDWVLGLSQSYVSTTEPLVETGEQTEEVAYATALNASYQMGSKMSLDLGVNQNFRDAGELSDLEEWTTDDWLNYQPGNRWGAGLGLILGYDILQPGSQMPFEQLQGRVNYHPGPKLTLTLSGGVEDRQFLDPSAPPLISPLFAGTLVYSNALTTVSLTASRTVTPSLYANEIEVITAYGGSIRQQLSKKFSVEGDAGYTSTPLTSIVPAPLPQYFIGAPPQSDLVEVLNDNTTSLTARLSYDVLQSLSLSVFYTWRDYSSGQANFSYISRQAGFSMNYRY